MVGPGPPPEGDDNKGPALIIVSCVSIFIVILVTVLRFAIRIRLSKAHGAKALGWDDWTILFAVVGNVIGVALDFATVHNGLGRPQYYLSEHQIREIGKIGYGQWMQAFATLMWTKISICLFLLRIPVTKALILPLQVAIVLLLVSNLALTGLWIGQCRPIAAVWDTSIEGKCFTKDQLLNIILSQAVISIVSDFGFSAYPILLLWDVRMKFSTKAGLTALMGVGVLTGACCIVRTVLNDQSIPEDKSYGGMVNLIWRLFEIRVGIVAACIPTLPAGYRWLVGTVSTMRSSKHTNKSSVDVQLAPGVNNPSAQTIERHKSFSIDSDLLRDLESGHEDFMKDRM